MSGAGAQRNGWTDERVAREPESWFASRPFDEWPPIGNSWSTGASDRTPLWCAGAAASAGRSSSASRSSPIAPADDFATTRSATPSEQSYTSTALIAFRHGGGWRSTRRRGSPAALRARAVASAGQPNSACRPAGPRAGPMSASRQSCADCAPGRPGRPGRSRGGERDWPVARRLSRPRAGGGPTTRIANSNAAKATRSRATARAIEQVAAASITFGAEGTVWSCATASVTPTSCPCARRAG